MEKVGKDPDYPSLIMVDAQVVKNTCTEGKENKVFCFYKLKTVLSSYSWFTVAKQACQMIRA